MLFHTKHFHAGLAYKCVETWLYGRCLQDQEDSPHQFCSVSLENGMCPRPWTTFSFKIIFHWIMGESGKRIFSSPATGNPRNTWNFQGEIWQSQWWESMAWEILVTPVVFAKFSIQSWLVSREKALTPFLLRQFLLRALRQCLVAAGAPADLVQLAPGYADAGKALVEHSDKAERGNREFRGNLLYFGYPKKWWHGCMIHDDWEFIDRLRMSSIYVHNIYIYIYMI